MDKKTVIVAGQNGQLGQYLIKYLLENEPNLNIVGTVRHKSYDDQEYIFDRKKIKTELMDLADSHSIESLIVKYKPDYFINTCANAFVGESWVFPHLQIELNSIGVLHQLEAIRKHSPRTRYFNMGTSEEFGCIKNNGPQNEQTKISPRSPYGCSKACARYLVGVYRESYNLYAIQGWTFNFESKLRHRKYFTKKVTENVARIYHSIKNNNWDFESLFVGNIYTSRSWQHASDVADGVWRMLNQDRFRTDWINRQDIDLPKEIKEYVLSESDTHSAKEFIEKSFLEAGIEGVWGNPTTEITDEQFVLLKDNKKIPLVKISKEFFRPLDVTYLFGDSTLIRNELGWSPKVDFDQIITEMVQSDIKLLASKN